MIIWNTSPNSVVGENGDNKNEEVDVVMNDRLQNDMDGKDVMLNHSKFHPSYADLFDNS